MSKADSDQALVEEPFAIMAITKLYMPELQAGCSEEWVRWANEK